MSREIHGPVERLSNRSTLLMGAVLVGGLVELGRSIKENRQKDIADVLTYPSDEGPSYIFLRGCGEDYQTQAPLYAKFAQRYGSLHFPYQIKGRHRQKIIDDGIIESCERDGERDRVFVPTSMGHMNLMRSLCNPRVVRAIGRNRLKGIITCYGMTSRDDLQPSMQQAANISAHTPPLSLVGELWAAHRMRRAHGELPHSPATDIDDVVLQHESSARMPFPLVASQHREIYKSKPWQPGSHHHIRDENPDLQIVHISGEYDSVVDRVSTKRATESSFGVDVIADIAEVPHGAHAENIAFPEPLLRRMAEFSHLNRGLAKSVVNMDKYRSVAQFAAAS